MQNTDIKVKINKDLIFLDFENIFENHDIYNVRFLIDLENGKLSMEQIKLWIEQQFYFSTQFPRCIAALYSNIDDYNISKLLMSFLEVEHWGSKNSSAHWKLYRKVLEYFGLEINILNSTKPLKETHEYLEYRLYVCTNLSVEEGLGALGYAHEFVNKKIFESYLKGVSKIPNINDDALLYFKAHVEDEPEDYQIFKNMITAHCNSLESFDLVKKGALDVLEKRMIFFNKFYMRISE